MESGDEGRDETGPPEERSGRVLRRRRGREIVLAGDRQTLNVLMLELATMVVAIALAFSASFLTVFRLDILAVFVFTTSVVIWFWWDYIRDRLLYPPVTSNFPYLDVFVLILISLLPFALRQGSVTYISGVLAVLLLVWALMISRIMSERSGSLSEDTMVQLRREIVQRAFIGLLLIVDSAVSFYYNLAGAVLLLVLLATVITWNVVNRGRKQVAKAEDASEVGAEPRVPGARGSPMAPSRRD